MFPTGSEEPRIRESSTAFRSSGIDNPAIGRELDLGFLDAKIIQQSGEYCAYADQAEGARILCEDPKRRGGFRRVEVVAIGQLGGGIITEVLPDPLNHLDE